MLPPPAIITRLHRLVHAAQLAHHLADVLGGGEEEHLVAGLDHRVAVGDDRPGRRGRWRRRARPRCGMWLRRSRQRLADQRPALERAHRDQASPGRRRTRSTCSASGNSISLRDVLGDDAARGRSRSRPRSRSSASSSGRARNRRERMRAMRVGTLKRSRADLAGDEVGLVALRDRDQHVGVLDAGLARAPRGAPRCRPRCAGRAGPAGRAAAPARCRRR